MDQNGPNDHFGQNDIISNWILEFARPFWSTLVHLGPPNRTLVIPENRGTKKKTQKPEQILGIVPGMGGGQICLCVALLLGEKGNT